MASLEQNDVTGTQYMMTSLEECEVVSSEQWCHAVRNGCILQAVGDCKYTFCPAYETKQLLD